MNYTRKATRLIAEVFQAKEINFDVITCDDDEVISVSLPVDFGPNVDLMFICFDNDTDVLVRIFNLIPKIPMHKRSIAMKVCNMLNREISYYKLFVNSEGRVIMGYDLPSNIPDDAIGKTAYELLLCATVILDNNFFVLSDILRTSQCPT